MNKIQDNFNYFKAKHKDIYEAYANYGKLIHEAGGPLDEKTRALIKVATSSISQYEYALETHIRKALSAGCSLDEIEHTLLLTAPSVGFPNMMSSIMILRRVAEG